MIMQEMQSPKKFRKQRERTPVNARETVNRAVYSKGRSHELAGRVTEEPVVGQ